MKKIVSIFVVCLLVVNLFYGIQVSAAVINGYCNSSSSGITWSLNTTTGVLTVKGKGRINSYKDIYSYKSYVKEIVIDEGITKIDEMTWSFENVEVVNIPSTVTYILFNEELASQHSLKKFVVDSDNPAYCDYEGKLFNKRKTHMLCYVGDSSETVYEVPSTVKKIGLHAFEAAENLDKLIIPEGVTQIDSYWLSIKYTSSIDITVLSPDCEFGPYQSMGVNVTLSGYEGSTTETLAAEKGYAFNVVEGKELESWKISKLPNKTTYNLNSCFESEGLTIECLTTDGTSYTRTQGIKVEGFDSSKEGDCTLTVNFADTAEKFDVSIVDNGAVGLNEVTTLYFQLDEETQEMKSSFNFVVDKIEDHHFYFDGISSAEVKIYDEEGYSSAEYAMPGIDWESNYCCFSKTFGEVGLYTIEVVLSDENIDSLNLRIYTSLGITKEPENIEAYLNEEVTLSVESNDTYCEYQWQESFDGGNYWTDMVEDGATKSSFTFNVDDTYDGYLYRCLLSNGYTSDVESESVSITLIEEPKEIITSTDVKIQGYQISNIKEGYRVVGSVEPTINGQNVKSWGFVYAITNVSGENMQVTDTDLYVDCENEYVASMQSTSDGNINMQMGESSTANYYVRTMLFAKKNSVEYTAKYKVRAYAELEDGSYVYSDICTYNIFDISVGLYKNKLMNNVLGHEYLYDNIISVVDSDFEKVDFEWSNTLLPPELM